MSPDLNLSSSFSRFDWSISPWISPLAKPWRCRLLLSSRTVVLRLAKIIAVSTWSCCKSHRSVSRFLRVSTGILNAVMSLLVDAARLTSIRLGLLRNFFASFSIGGGIVAENSMVCRVSGSLSQMNSMSGIKPISSMRSASSITRSSQPLSRILPRSNRSIKRPGVAISTSTPSSSALSWSPIWTPPISNAMVKSWFLPYFSKFSATCAASSRVGSRIKERGIRARRRPAAMTSIIGKTKLAVLPVPVCAIPMRSFIIRTAGMASA